MKKQQSIQSIVAKQIRTELKKAFPSVKFSVTSCSFSMGNAVDIHWYNGATYKMVDDVVGKYQYGHFDGMTDSYEYSNKRKDIEQVKFVQTNRTITEDAIHRLNAKLKHGLAGFENVTDIDKATDEFMNFFGCWTPREYLLRQARDLYLI